jgi:hypothetical protein
MTRRTRRTLLIVAGVLLLLALAIFLRSKAPPEAARLLPESDGIVYVNLKPVRALYRKSMKAPVRASEYQQFVDETGIDWERDLDEAAVALHRMPDPKGPNGPVAYSWVLVGKITGPRLRQWLEAHSLARETYGGKVIYSILSDGRTVRVSQIGYDMVAISNTPTPEQIHSIVDRHRTAAWPLAGSSLLEQHYREVPLLAFAWGVGQIGTPFNESGAISILGFDLPLQADSTYIASVAPELSLAGALRLRVEEIAPTNDAAATQAAALGALVTLARGITPALGDHPANRALKDLLKTAEVSQNRDRVIVRATLSASFFASLVEERNTSSGQPTSAEPSASK